MRDKSIVDYFKPIPASVPDGTRRHQLEVVDGTRMLRPSPVAGRPRYYILVYCHTCRKVKPMKAFTFKKGTAHNCGCTKLSVSLPSDSPFALLGSTYKKYNASCRIKYARVVCKRCKTERNMVSNKAVKWHGMYCPSCKPSRGLLYKNKLYTYKAFCKLAGGIEHQTFLRRRRAGWSLDDLVQQRPPNTWTHPLTNGRRDIKVGDVLHKNFKVTKVDAYSTFGKKGRRVHATVCLRCGNKCKTKSTARNDRTPKLGCTKCRHRTGLTISGIYLGRNELCELFNISTTVYLRLRKKHRKNLLSALMQYKGTLQDKGIFYDGKLYTRKQFRKLAGNIGQLRLEKYLAEGRSAYEILEMSVGTV